MVRYVELLLALVALRFAAGTAAPIIALGFMVARAREAGGEGLSDWYKDTHVIVLGTVAVLLATLFWGLPAYEKSQRCDALSSSGGGDGRIRLSDYPEWRRLCSDG